ncbi:hypothetical protein HAX54_031905 [Datura stramonium]|uniref:Uncharacterized protein n=1 Tax=Datura stramonium TaxID=4076 RepID=A0ABS8V9W7_DATST|nr:hypothetical protein [Datura stramonium]
MSELFDSSSRPANVLAEPGSPLGGQDGLGRPPRGHHSSTPPKLTSFSPGQNSRSSSSRAATVRPLYCGRDGSRITLRPAGPRSAKSVSPRAETAAVALKIIHAGGVAEYYYMATPAARILEKYPSFILARP